MMTKIDSCKISLLSAQFGLENRYETGLHILQEKIFGPTKSVDMLNAARYEMVWF